MRIDILDEKISTIENKLNKLILNMETQTKDRMESSDLLGKLNLEYVFIGVAVFVLLLFIMILIALSRSKEAMKKATKATENMRKVSKQETPKEAPKKQTPKEEIKDVEPVVLKTESES